MKSRAAEIIEFVKSEGFIDDEALADSFIW